jgi:hypothetical protein
VSADTPVGATEIAARADVDLDTVKRWRERYRERYPTFPAVRWTVGGRPAWSWLDVARWLLATGRPRNGACRARVFADVVHHHLAEDGGWVARDVLLTLAPSGRHIVIPELDGEELDGGDHARGSAWDAGPTGRPDGGLLADAIDYLRARGHRADPPWTVDEGYPRDEHGDPGPRAFRIGTEQR